MLVSDGCIGNEAKVCQQLPGTTKHIHRRRSNAGIPQVYASRRRICNGAKLGLLVAAEAVCTASSKVCDLSTQRNPHKPTILSAPTPVSHTGCSHRNGWRQGLGSPLVLCNCCQKATGRCNAERCVTGQNAKSCYLRHMQNTSFRTPSAYLQFSSHRSQDIFAAALGSLCCLQVANFYLS